LLGKLTSAFENVTDWLTVSLIVVPVYSDEETGGPGGKALAQLAVYIFVAALNNGNEDNMCTSGKASSISGSKRMIEWDYLATPGFRYPPPKKMTLAEDELGIMILPSNSSNISYIRNKEHSW